MSIISQLSEAELSQLEDRAASLYVEIQKRLEELNDAGEMLRASGIVPQFSVELNGWISLDPFDAPDLGKKLTLRASYYRRPASKRARELWNETCTLYGRPPDAVHRTDKGYIAVFKREGAIPLYINESMREVHGSHGMCRFSAASLEALRQAFGSMCPSWAKPREPRAKVLQVGARIIKMLPDPVGDSAIAGVDENRR